MPARLVSLCGRPTILLTKSLTVVGRQPTCDIRIDSARVSRCHCCLLLEDGGVVVRDLDSTNGTYVNGRTILSDRLQHDDILTIGHLAYRVCLESQVSNMPAAVPEVPSGSDQAQEQPTALESDFIDPVQAEEPPDLHHA